MFAIARKTLTDLASTSLEERMADVFIRRLRTLDGQAKEDFAEALEDASGPVLVRSAFDLPAEQRARSKRRLTKPSRPLGQASRSGSRPRLIWSAALSSAPNGQKLAWSIADYLASLEKGVTELLKTQAKTKRRTQARTKRQ